MVSADDNGVGKLVGRGGGGKGERSEGVQLTGKTFPKLAIWSFSRFVS